MATEQTNELEVFYYTAVLADEDVVPFIRELECRFGRVNAGAAEFEPPAVGFSEIAMVLTALGGVVSAAFITGFFEDLGSESARQLRIGLKRVLDRGRSNRSGRRYSPLCIQLGKARFHFHQAVDEDELLKRIRKADELVKSLPAEAFDGLPPGPSEFGFYWDVESQIWRGGIMEIYGEYWRPNRFWEEL